MVDAGRLRRLLDRLGDEVAHLRRLAALTDEELHDEADLLPAVKYRFVVAIEAAIDAGEHIIASEGLPAPETFAEVFTVLGAHGWLPGLDVSALQRMAGFRNVLVHGYADVDDHRVIETLRTRLDDLAALRRVLSERAMAEGGSAESP